MACAKCAMNNSGDRAAYTVKGSWGNYTWDVNAAQQLVKADGREAVLVPDTVLTKLLAVNKHFVREHLEHVKGALEEPGIIARLGDRVALIDGTHRAARCRMEGRPFFAYMMSQRESEECLIGFPVPFRQGGSRRIA